LENDDAAEFVENGGIVRGARVREQGGSVLFVGDAGAAGHARTEKGSIAAIAIGDGGVVGGARCGELRCPPGVDDTGGPAHARKGKAGWPVNFFWNRRRTRVAEDKGYPALPVGNVGGAGLGVDAEYRRTASIIYGRIRSHTRVVEVCSAATVRDG